MSGLEAELVGRGTSLPKSRSALPAGPVEKSIFWMLVALVGIAAFPLGANRPMPAAILAAFTGALLIAWGVAVGLSKAPARVRVANVAGPVGCYALVCLWAAIQWSPWIPASLADPIWQEARRVLGIETGGRISVNPEATLAGLMHLLTYAGVFWLSMQLTNTAERARTAVRAAALIGGAYAVYGIVVFLAGNNSILIYSKWAYPDSLTSTFVNRNSFATFAGLGLLCAATLMLDKLRHLLALQRPLRGKVVLLIEELVVRSSWITAVVLSLAIALILSGSRGGVLSSMAGLFCLLSAYLARGAISRSQLALISSTLVAIAALAYITSSNHLTSRLGADDVADSMEGRSQTYALAADAVMTSPWTGTGLGTFADVFPAYRSDDHPTVIWDKAHNTYLENALELGLPAAILLNLSVALLALRTLRGVFKRRREKILPAIGVAATVIVGLHSLVDFSLQIPAVTILYAFILGMSVSQSWSTSTSD